MEGKRVMEDLRGGRRLRDMVAEASFALARLNADRLEELAICCQALNREISPASDEMNSALVCQSREAGGEMAVFARVLDATRANLNVMHRLRELRAGRLEYKERQGQGWERTENSHGDH
jgi:hypothetical protein